MASSAKKTVVLGASANPQRYSYMAIHRLRSHNHPTVAIGRRKGIVGDTEIGIEQKPLEDVDTITLYLSAANQKPYYDYILSLRPKRIIFNPGAENDELYDLARENGIQPMEACTLVMLTTGQY